MLKATTYKAQVIGKDGEPQLRVQDKTSGAVMVACRWLITAEINADNQEIQAPDNQTVMSYTCIIGKDGKPNANGMNAMKTIFGWKPVGATAFQMLEAGDYTGIEALLTLKEDSYNGKTTLKVDWIDTLDRSLGGAGQADLTGLGKKYGHLFAPPANRQAPRPMQPARPAAPKPAANTDLSIPEEQIPF